MQNRYSSTHKISSQSWHYAKKDVTLQIHCHICIQVWAPTSKQQPTAGETCTVAEIHPIIPSSNDIPTDDSNTTKQNRNLPYLGLQTQFCRNLLLARPSGARRRSHCGIRRKGRYLYRQHLFGDRRSRPQVPSSHPPLHP